MKIKTNIYSIYIYLILILAAFIHLSGKGYIFLLDFVPKLADHRILELLYGKVVPVYGGTLPLELAMTVEISQKILILITLFLGAYSMNRFMGNITSDENAKFYSGLLFIFNPYTYLRIVSGQLLPLFSYSILPLMLMKFIELIEKKDLKEMIKFTILLSIVAFNIHIFLISLIIMAILFLFWFNKNKDFKILRIFIIPIILFVFLNSYWILPLITSNDTIVDNIGERDYEAFAPKGGLLDIASMYGFWNEGYLSAKDFLPGVQILYLVILSLAIIGFIYYYNDQEIGIYVKSFAVIGILGFILASGINGPFGEIVRWLFDNTLLKGFRDSQKFVAMMVMAYAVLGGLGIKKIKSEVSDE